jgi:hypothetical protein
MILGVTELIFGLAFGCILKKIDKYLWINISCSIGWVNVIVVALAYYFKSYPLCFLSAFTTGFYESSITNGINLLIA